MHICFVIKCIYVRSCVYVHTYTYIMIFSHITIMVIQQTKIIWNTLALTDEAMSRWIISAVEVSFAVHLQSEVTTVSALTTGPWIGTTACVLLGWCFCCSFWASLFTYKLLPIPDKLDATTLTVDLHMYTNKSLATEYDIHNMYKKIGQCIRKHNFLLL